MAGERIFRQEEGNEGKIGHIRRCVARNEITSDLLGSLMQRSSVQDIPHVLWKLIRHFQIYGKSILFMGMLRNSMDKGGKRMNYESYTVIPKLL